MPTTTKRRRSKRSKARKTPRAYKPEDMSLADWQIALRREFGREQRFKLAHIDNDGQHVFSDFNVTNPTTRRTYRVTIRGLQPGDNHCTCPDFAVNTLGTCKHIEFTLARLMHRTGAKAALRQGFKPPFSEIWLRYGVRRQLVLRRGSAIPSPIEAKLEKLLESDGTLRDEAIERFDELLADFRRADHEIRLHDDAMEFLAQRRDLRRLRDRIDEMFPRGENSAAFNGAAQSAALSVSAARCAVRCSRRPGADGG